MDLYDALKAYWDRFGEPFPMEQYGGGDKDMVAEIERCLADGEPYKPSNDVDW